MSAADFFKAYAQAMRKLEIQLLQTVINGMSAVTTPLWMVTLVNKQDLWWNEQKAVRRHYEGEYTAKIGDLEKALGSSHFQHEILPVSFTMTNLSSDGGSPLARTNAGYDLPTHLRYLESMFTRVHGLMAGGPKK